ncbi:MAG: XdhC family protein [Cyclobacteriaceae bacterium]|nr:XdhC family protein [Cyclobacteriaceae bacterium]
METMYLHFLKLLETHKSLALATILRTAGSTPQVPGASAIFSTEGILAGTLGGGILEYETGKKARDAMKAAESILMEYDLNAGIHDESGAICGGKASILIDVEPGKNISAFRQLKAAFQDRKPGALVTIGTPGPLTGYGLVRSWIGTDLPEEMFAGNLAGHKKSIIRSIHNRIPLLLWPAGENVAAAGKDTSGFIFIDPVLPPERLILIGAGHVGKALIRLADRLGFDMTVIDNRPDLIQAGDLPAEVKVRIGDIEKETGKFKIDRNTYIVIATQGHRYDADALKACIRSNAAYIGLMGSQRKIRLMRERFIDEGWASGREFDAVYAPVGIDIHSETVEEIAVSITAELIKVRREQRDRYKIPHISSLILAAGESRRMRQQKLLMDYHGESFIRTIVRKSLASEVDETLVVLGSHSKEIFEEISIFGVNTAYNPLFKEGMLSSIQCGFKSISKWVNAVVLLLGDQPMVEPDVIDQLINMYRKTRAGIIIPVYQGERGHPVLIDTRFRQEIFSLDPKKGLRELMYNHPEEIRELEVNSPNILKDIDNVEDYNIEIT